MMSDSLTSQSEYIVLTIHGKVAQVTLNRPQVGNAFNDAIRNELPRLLEALDGDDSCSAIILNGAGERGFCVGADIKESRTIGSSVQERRRLKDNAWIDRIASLSKPLVAAIHGYCLGGGLELALACDLRIAAPGAVFGLPETGLGLIPGGGGTQRLPRLIGLGRAMDLLLTGDRVSSEEALRTGLVTRVASNADNLVAEALAVAARIAARPPTATAYAKEAAKTGLEIDLQAGLTLEKTLFALLMSTTDRAEAAAAFRDKREPRFTGN
jgi:enoyl-CoA hydratase/carnithine racemase